MMRRVILVFVGTLLAGAVAVARPVQTPAQPQCTLARKGRFDLGWMQKTETGSYRCVPTFVSR